ncbi:MAG: SLBB domain-containing protein [Proteobacteria bacterium]|nr:SLBB domain-containing protein [Pseudomonadota bacterium]
MTNPLFCQDYTVGEDDVITITVYNQPQLSTKVRVSGDGAIVLPLLGNIRVKGLNVIEISEKLTGLYADGYLVNPQISVFIEEYSSKKATILGMVKTPGHYSIRQHTTILEFISMAGGLAANAGSTAIITRKSKAFLNKPEMETIQIDLASLIEKGQTSQNVPIYNGDSIYIPKMEVIYINGEVKKPDAYKYEQGTTIIMAITLASGFTDKAAPGKIKIIRKINGEEVVITKTDMDEPVLAGDIIVVPESIF